MANKHSEEVLVSIIIPVYNREEIIAETIACATNQTYKNLEIIISDNCSTDDTWEVLQKLSLEDERIQLIQNERNVGPVLNWKAAIDKASGEYLKILWSDDKISNNFVERCLDDFNEDVAFVISPVQIFDDRSRKVLAVIDYDGLKEFTRESFLFNMLIHNKYNFMVSPGCALFREEDLRKALYIDIPNNNNLDFKNYGAGNDLLIFLLISLTNKKIKVNQNSESFFRSHAKSISFEKQSEINLYYEWSKQFFINNFYPKLENAYKSKLFLKLIFDKKLTKLYNGTKGRLSPFLILRAAFRKLFLKE